VPSPPRIPKKLPITRITNCGDSAFNSIAAEERAYLTRGLGANAQTDDVLRAVYDQRVCRLLFPKRLLMLGAVSFEQF
jgi:hypothetical protein